MASDAAMIQRSMYGLRERAQQVANQRMGDKAEKHDEAILDQIGRLLRFVSYPPNAEDRAYGSNERELQ